MLTKSQSSWTAILLATQSRERTRRDWWLRSVNASELDSIERWRSGILRSDERRSNRTICAIFVPRFGNPNEDCNTKRQFDGEFFSGSIGSRTSSEAHRNAVLMDARTSQRWRLQYQEGATAKNCADIGTKPVSASVLQQRCKFAGLKNQLTMDPTLLNKMKGATAPAHTQRPDVITRGIISTETDSCQRGS